VYDTIREYLQGKVKKGGIEGYELRIKTYAIIFYPRLNKANK
jgi:hypothetical protein